MRDKNQRNDKGQRHGLWERYWGNGLLYYKVNYVNGGLFGLYETYHSDGDLMFKMYYAR